MIRVLVAACLLTTTSAWPLAQRATSKTPVTKTSTAATCSADLGAGVKTRRKFCDAVVARDASSGIVIAIPPHRGTAVLRFDLHARFAVPAADAQPGSAFARHLAVVAVVRASGAVIGRGAVVSELRGRSDLYDQIAGGGGADGMKTVAPGQPEAVQITIPAGISSVSIVGVSLESTTRAGRDVFDAPGRPVAIVSNWRVEYTPVQ